MPARQGVDWLPCLTTLFLAYIFMGGVCLPYVRSMPGPDLYQYWVVNQVRRHGPPGLDNPYTQQSQYTRHMSMVASASADAKLKAAQSFRAELDLNNSPLLYAVFAWLPESYPQAYALHVALSALFFLAAMALLARAYALDRNQWTYASYCLALLLAFDPVLTDLRAGNVNAFQLAVVAGLVWLAKARPRAATAIGFGALAAFCVLFKANTAIVVASLAGCFWLRQGGRWVAWAAAAGLVTGGCLWAWSCVWFGSWTIWGQWFDFAFVQHGGRLAFPVHIGNFSTPLLVSQVLGTGVAGSVALGLGALALGASMLLAAGGAGARGRTAGIAREPSRMVALGMSATMVCSPLAWVHHFTLLVLPATYLLLCGGVLGKRLAAAALLMASGVLTMFWADEPEAAMLTAAVIGLSWIPLWAGAALNGEASSDDA